MLHFFRKYQRIFFAVMSVIIISSFSFFGTYGAVNSQVDRNETAFHDASGNAVSKHELDQMAQFLATDVSDKLNYIQMKGFNYLNDGVVAKDFVGTGLAEVIYQYSAANYTDDIRNRVGKEKAFRPYENPQSQFLSAKNTWNYFAPNIPKLMEKLAKQEDPSSLDAFKIRSELFMAERQFPPAALRRMLQYQAQQYQWIPKDPQLDYADLSLFGHHSAYDWYGPKFVQDLCRVIINASRIAEKRGYSVSRSEALADLLRNSDETYEKIGRSKATTANNAAEFFDEQLRAMHMDRNTAVNIWTKVLLFRRLFHDYGSAVVTDGFSEKLIREYTNEYVGGNLYHLPEELKLATFKDLQDLEVYLDAVSDRSGSPLAFPTKFYGPKEVYSQYPSLVQQRFLVQLAELDKESLQTRVGVKEMWNWQTEENNWKALSKEFPELATKQAKNSKERFNVLEKLDENTRGQIDTFTRREIVNKHPEWIQEALGKAEAKEVTLSVRRKGGNLPIEGLKDTAAFALALKQQDASLQQYSADQRHFYRIKVLKQAPDEEVLTFAEARRDGTIGDILNDKLEKHYKSMQARNTANFKNKDDSLKNLKDVVDEVAADYFKDVLKAIKAKYPKQKDMTNSIAASKRMGAHVEKLLLSISQKGDGDAIRSDAQLAFEERAPLEEQWKLLKTPYRIVRHQETKPAISIAEAFSLNDQEWSKLASPVNGDFAFFQRTEHGTDMDQSKLTAKVEELHQMLSSEAQKELMHQLADQLIN